MAFWRVADNPCSFLFQIYFDIAHREDNSSWKKDSCTSCFCDEGVITCSKQVCKDPQCDVTRGQSLVIPPNSCCPVCSMTSERHCVTGEGVVAHNTEWEGQNCTTCACRNGDISCSPVQCERKECGYGEVFRRVPGVCCPICVSLEANCNYEGNTYRDGETWHPSNCEKAFCNKGEVIRHIAHCEDIICGSGQRAVVQEGECCPTCVGRSCVYEGREYASGKQFQFDQCNQCICQLGEVRCKSQHCNVTNDVVDVTCSQGERRVTRRGGCCPECVSTQETCDYHGVQYYHGDLWNISKCEVAFCSHGNVRSVYVQCSPVKCKWNERLVHASCCPECVPISASCRHKGFEYRHGDQWKEGSCKRCECMYGMTQCYTADCPLCPAHTMPVSVPGECCPDCQPVTCHADCETCDAPGYAHCTSCKRNRLLQEGKCLRKCLPGFYQDGKRCKACHSSCATCDFGNSPYVCASCASGRKLQAGKCVAECNEGYFAAETTCKACPKGCSSCLNTSHCLTCLDRTRMPQGGACVQQCGENFFHLNGSCRACQDSCSSCSGDSNYCTSCPLGKLMESGLCVKRCSAKYYQLSISRCADCHSTCATCSGPSASQCLSCDPPHSFLYMGKCVPKCPPKHYPRGGRCEACYHGCQTCVGSLASDCSSCAESGRVFRDGRCDAKCAEHQYLDGIICRNCHKSCASCHEWDSCTSCSGSNVLLITSHKIQHCLTPSRCIELGLSMDSSLSLCHNASAARQCHQESRHLYNGECVIDCPQDTFAKTSDSGTLCLSCPDGCGSCDPDGRCKNCKSGRFLSSLSKNCLRNCEPGYYASSSSGTCLACPSSCATCVASTSSPQPRCTSCRDVTAVLQSGQCAAHCVDQFYPELNVAAFGTAICRECDWSCTRCSGSSSSDCLDCMEGRRLQNGSCVEKCSEGYYLSYDECRRCSDENCDSCTGANHCSGCLSPYFLHENTCIKSCPRGYYVDSVTRSCLSCSNHCLLCSSRDSCSQCDAQTFMMPTLNELGENDGSQRISSRRTINRHDSPCVRECERGYYGNKHTRRCEINRKAPVLEIRDRLLVGIGSRVVVNVIRVTDDDTSLDDVFLTLVMAPANGWFELNGERLPSEARIPCRDVEQNGLLFVHDSARRRHGVATFQASDRQLTSARLTLAVAAVSQIAPVVLKNKLLVVSAGESAKISARSCFLLKDEDNPNDVTIDVIYPPKHGRIVKLPSYETQLKTFKMTDLNGDVVTYVTHGNLTSSSVLHDTVTLQISDGYHVINSVIHVDVIPQGSSKALVLGNKGTYVRRGGMTRITNQQLLTIATNVKDKSKIVYVIKQRKKRGQVVLMVPEMSDAPMQYGINMMDWRRNTQGHYQSPPMIRFSQREIDNGYIWYRDAGDKVEENQIEAFEFEVYDESREPARPLGGDEFRVNYVKENVEPPHLAHGMSSSPQMVANEGRLTVLHSGYLHYTDEDTPDRDLIYNITRPLPPSFGIIENSDHPFVPISVFTQADVDSNKIIYRPPIGGIPSVQYELGRYHSDDRQRFKYGRYRPLTTASHGRPKLNFQFTVSDGEHTLTPENFTIKLSSHDTAPPSFITKNPSLEVELDGTVTIGDLMLAVRDPDTQPRDLIYTLVKAPRYGTLVRNSRGTRIQLGEGASFNYVEIQSSSFRYKHNGDKSGDTDQLQVSVTDGTDTITEVIQINIIGASRSRGPHPDPRTELSVVVSESSEVVISRENLAFSASGSEDDQIVYHVESEPFHGLLMSRDAGPLVPGSSFTQQDIDSSKISYHSRGEIGSLSVTDVVQFHVTDASGNQVSDQTLTITITPSLHQPPTVTTRQTLIVRNRERIRINQNNFVASDVDTRSQDLIVSILQKPTLGEIINVRDKELMRNSHHEDVWFTVQDMIDGNIYYRYTDDSDSEIASDHFRFRVNDGFSSTSTYRLNITIELSHNNEPSVRTATVVCQSGHALLIKNVSLTVIDSDTSNDDLVFTVTSNLRYGKLVKFKEKLPHDMLDGWKLGMMKQKPGNAMMKAKQANDLTVGSSFTYQDILDQKICYENTESAVGETRSSRRRRDVLSFRLYDGFNHQNGELDIDVEPEPPALPEEPTEASHATNEEEEVGEDEDNRDSNDGEELDQEEEPTSPTEAVVKPPLKPVDEQTSEREEEENEMTILEPDYEEFDAGVTSELVLEANTGITVESGSVTSITSSELRVAGSNGDVSYVITRDPNVGQLQFANKDNVANLSASGENEFTQEQIDNGNIRYYHPVSEGGGEVFFMFDVIGGMVDLRFNIHVKEDRIPPKIVVNNGLTVKEGGTRKIGTQQLSATDESGHLVYEITEAPKLGRLEQTGNPGHSISRFTQDNLVSGRVQYVHTSESERTDDQFAFSLTDGTNSIVQTFNIRVLLVDNSLPVLENLGIRVQEGVRKTITEFELKATDRDTNNDLIRFNIVQPPKHGSVDRTTNGRRYVPVTSFTMDDIYQSHISYNHDGTNSLTDSFTFTITDGTNEQFMIYEEGNLVTTTQAQDFPIEVVPVDDGTPRLITNLGLNHLEYMDNKALSVITKRLLLTEDPDTEPEHIIYTVTSDPRHGHLESTLNSGDPIRRFSQANINTGLIRYVLSDVSTEATRDSFMFNVRDSLPNVVTGNTFNIRWSVISFEKSNYTVNEESGTIDIPVLRRGNLNQYAIVLCRTEPGTATSSASGSTRSTSGQLDYMEHAGQVQFDEHETEKICSIQINDDRVFEGTESFTVELTMPADALLGNITRTTVYINDEKDTPTLQFIDTQYTVEERDTVVYVPIKRTGDVEKPVTVICFTETRSATGSVQGRIESGSDYKTRGRHSGESIVTFAPGVSSVTCDVKIIDDSVYEDSEEFVVKLVDASAGAKIGKFPEATVTITGPNDSPTVFLTDSSFTFAENAGTVDIPIHRSGPDLSRPTDVWCATKQSDPVSAAAGEDFVATSTKITFRNDETVKLCTLTILDDSQTPTVEGNETFVVHLDSVQKARLATPHEAVVIINDTLDDVPKFGFLESSVQVKETDGVVSLAVQRDGDISSRASVICYTRQNTASVEQDFTERPLTEMSRIVFEPGQRASLCNVSVVDDKVYESSETFTVRLTSATGEQWYGARVGENNQVQVTLTNNEDAPTLEFELAEYSIREPDSAEATRQLSVKIIRTGDSSEVSKVRCSTRDGSAKSGSDYEPKSRLVRFQPGQTSVTFKVNILSNEVTEWHETFLIVLGPHDPVNAVLGARSQTTITILDKDASGSLVLPSTPVVVSLLHYDEVDDGLKTDPSPGYPLVCVTPCDPKYPKYSETRNLCEEAAINSTAIRFSWEVAMPTEEGQGVPPFETVTDTTPFTSVDRKVLDSIYFGRRFHVRCVAQAVDSVTHAGGTPLHSNVVTIATDSGLCHNPIVSGSERNFQAQSFIANLKYIPPESDDHPNTLHVSVKIPHQDGRLPLISTMPFNNLKFLLSRSIDRQQHVCSNLMYSDQTSSPDQDEEATGVTRTIGTRLGFIEDTDYSKLSLGPGYDKPYQFDPNVREARTIDLYKYLNLKSCIWQFDAYYHMNELIDYCNGKLHPDFQLRDAAESQVTVSVPLYVSYVYVTAPRGWGSLEHHTDMEFSFRYKNVYSRGDIQTDGVLSGRIQVLRIKIRDDGKLEIDFKTRAKFRGLFVSEHRTLPGKESQIVPPEGMNIGFKLTNMWSEETFDSPYQLWRATSTYSRKDYSGEYTVELIPCTVTPTQKWQATTNDRAISCTAYSPEKFKIPIMFQQTNRPVPVVYTLQTEFQLCNNEKVYMMDPKDYEQDTNYDYTGSFTKGQTIFGRVLWTPDQDLKSSYRLQLEKVYLCTGRDGNIPYFDPSGSVYGNGPQYGCIEPNKNLQHRFLLLDRSNRDAENRKFHDVPFDAYFASDRPEFAGMSHIPGVDGFSLKVDALYKVEAGHQWYIQVLYVIGPDTMLPRVKRSALFKFSSNKASHRMKRSNYLNKNGELSSRDILTAGWRGGESRHNGTNMRGIAVEAELQQLNPLMIIIPTAVVLALLLILFFCLMRRRRKKKTKQVEFEMATRKKVAIEASDESDDDDNDVCSSDGKYSRVNVVSVSSRKKSLDYEMEKNCKANRVRVSDRNLNNCEAPLMAKPRKSGKANNTRDPGKPLLRRRENLDIVNNLRDSGESGTEV
ncbi:unnamed protein product [Clavelina lepadiformis]|uniref:VWFC domain-containing protein n=1 Tax=Clavelina lepadiformis TaxID=159417 RepID=A0ABP0EW06_CLALP